MYCTMEEACSLAKKYDADKVLTYICVVLYQHWATNTKTLEPAEVHLNKKLSKLNKKNRESAEATLNDAAKDYAILNKEDKQLQKKKDAAYRW